MFIKQEQVSDALGQQVKSLSERLAKSSQQLAK
eukprot:COSAG01_NODE_6678_length_3549_cov_23.615362_5_plen_33_part_00